MLYANAMRIQWEGISIIFSVLLFPRHIFPERIPFQMLLFINIKYSIVTNKFPTEFNGAIVNSEVNVSQLIKSYIVFSKFGDCSLPPPN